MCTQRWVRTMPLTPEDVSNKRFTPVRLREGYDMGEVDQFLDEVEAELARLTKENDDLRAKLSAAQTGGARRRFEPRPPSRPPWSRRPPEPEPEPEPEPAVAAAAAAVPARPSASRPSRRPPTPRPGCSRSRPATPTSSSTRPRTRPTRSSARPAPRPSASTPSPRPRPTASSPTPAPAPQMLDSETAERRQQMFGELERERDKLNGEVENLRAFEREYRSRLKSYFTQQLEALGRSGRVAGASATSSRRRPSGCARSSATRRAELTLGATPSTASIRHGRSRTVGGRLVVSTVVSR